MQLYNKYYIYDSIKLNQPMNYQDKQGKIV